MSPERAHRWASRVFAQHEGEMRQLAWAARAADQEELALELMDIPRKAKRIADDYFNYRGREDADLIDEVLVVERKIKQPLTNDIMLSGQIDLVTRFKDGLVGLWEHKSSKSTPPVGRRLRDFQTILYKEALELDGDIWVDAIVWNYLRTVEPREPEITKKGALARKEIDTTWPVYAAAILRNDLDIRDYADMELKLRGREYDRYFVRHILPVNQDAGILIRDFVRSAEEVRQATSLYQQGALEPIRNIGRHCDFCQFNRLCDAVITGGNDDTIKKQMFTIRRKDYGPTTNQEREPELDLQRLI